MGSGSVPIVEKGNYMIPSVRNKYVKSERPEKDHVLIIKLLYTSCAPHQGTWPEGMWS